MVSSKAAYPESNSERCSVSDGLPTLMRAQMAAEFELAHKPVADLVNALKGIASCGTDCKCCQLHKEIAEEALTAYNQTVQKHSAASQKGLTETQTPAQGGRCV
jgi:hypothetical protein